MSGDEVLNISDHRPIRVTLNIDNHRSNGAGRVNARFKRWDKLDRESMRVKYTQPLEHSTLGLLRKLESNTINENDLDCCIDTLIEHIKEAAKGIPTYKFRRHLKPYWNEKLDKLKKDKVHSYNLWVAAGWPRAAGNGLWVKYKSTKKSFFTERKRLAKQYEDEQIAHAVKAAEVDRGQFWKLVKKSRNNSGIRIAAIKDKSGKVISDLDGILDVWKDHFANL